MWGRRPFRTAIEMYREAGEFLLAVTAVMARADHEIRKLRVVQEAHHMTVRYHPQNGVRSLSSYFVTTHSLGAAPILVNASSNRCRIDIALVCHMDDKVLPAKEKFKPERERSYGYRCRNE
jgi:hypothetical protein